MSRQEYHVSVDDDGSRHALLVEALLGSHDMAYRNSPEFHATVDTIARALPILIEVLYEDASRLADMRNRYLAEQYGDASRDRK